MMNDYLIDTSVWIDFFRQRQTRAVNEFYRILDSERRVYKRSVIHHFIDFFHEGGWRLTPYPPYAIITAIIMSM